MQGIFWEGNIQNNAIGQIAAEIFKDHIYLPYLGGKKDLVILDIGAFTGIFSLYASQFASKIYAVEPSTETFEVLKHSLKFNGLEDKVLPFKLAITNIIGKRPLSDSRNKTARTLFTNEGAEGREPEMVDVVTLEKFMDDNKIEHVDFMKLDPEGAEVEILSGDAFKRIAHKIDSLLLESHYFSGRNPHQIVEALRNNGYKIEKVPNEADLLYATRI